MPIYDEIPGKFHDALTSANLEYASLSWGGFNLFGDRKSIDEAKHLQHEAGNVEVYYRPELLASRKLAHEWMVKHDKLLGFIQKRPAMLKELIETAQNEGKMDAKLKKKWIRALRGKKYKQGSDCLLNDDGSMCCLGVLGDIQGLDHAKMRKRMVATLPGDLNADLDADTRNNLANMNDGRGSPKMTFKQIADYIERNL